MMLLRAVLTSALFILLIPTLGCQKESESIVSIALHPTNAHILYVATNDAVYKSRDGGSTWERFLSFSARRVTTLAIDPLLPATIYAGTMGDAVYKSPDGGQHWLPHNVGLKEHVSFVNQFVFHPALNDKIYIATTVGAFHTKDAGREWEARMNGMKEVHIVTSIAINLKDPTILYGGTTGGMYRSDDGATSWKRINNGLIPDSELMASMALGVNAIEIDRTNRDIIYAGTTKGLFRTTNKGEQWERIGQSLADPFISSILLHPTEPSQLYVGGPKGGWKSSDGGKTWQAMNQGFATLNIRALAMNSKNPQLLYAGTNGSGLYRSTDAGATWMAVPLKAARSSAGSGRGQG
ncbi:MAG: YCF48-related protein [Nitrospira sp.]|nr:YCF48-related protein [Nitrospira sp.]